jgi:uncharacterized protein RhaS with RHS repeats
VDPGTLPPTGPPPTPADFRKLLLQLSPLFTIRTVLAATSVAGGPENNAVSFLHDASDSLLAVVPTWMKLPAPQATARSLPAPSVLGTEPVAADGEFTLQETDVTLAGIGLPFEFTRYYRSGIDYQSSIGWGWNHNFGLRIVEAFGTYDRAQGCSSPHNDVFVLTEWMDRMRFAYVSTEGGVDHYASRSGQQGYRLRRDHRESDAPWILEDVKGREYRFDHGWGTLASINDLAGHSLVLSWDRAATNWDPPGGRVTQITDTTGRVIYFNYQATKFQVRTFDTHEYQFQALQCLSLTPNCHFPLVSFETRGSIGESSAGFRVEFDLIRVLDGNGNGPRYSYYDGENAVLNPRYSFEIPSAELPSVCSAICSDEVTNCRNADICETFVQNQVEKCNSLAYISGPTEQLCWQWCMSQKDWTDAEGFKNASKSCQAVTAPIVSNTPIPHLTNGCGPFREFCLAILGDIPSQTTLCRASCVAECIATKGSKSGYIYGVRPDLSHNLMNIVDGDGRALVSNKYGEDQHSPDFDKVISHSQGDEANNTLTFAYYDLQAPEPPPARPDDRFVVRVSEFNSLDICPNGGPSPAGFRLGPHPVQPPKYATVIHDTDGTVTTNYHDPSWRLIRSINHTANLEFDYNYKGGALSALYFPAGNRTCFQTDPLGKPTLITEYPAPKFPGSQTPLVTQLTYDDKEQLIEVVRNPNSQQPSGRHFSRDKFERVVAIGDQVNFFQTNWTCFSYTDPLIVSPNRGIPNRIGIIRQFTDSTRREPEHILARRRFQSRFRSLSELKASAVTAPASAYMFYPSGCAAIAIFTPPTLLPHQRDELPSKITRPDGSVTTLSELSSGGPGKTILDVNGPDPLSSYSSFDDLGRLSETGRLLNKDGTMIRYPALRRMYDEAGLLTTQSVTDPNTGAWVDTSYGYDKSHHVTSVTTPAYSRQLSVSPLGDVDTIIDVPSAGDPAKSRSTCVRYDVHGRPLLKILPEGNIESYFYDVAGRLHQVHKGYSSEPLGSWAAKCNAVIVQPDTSKPLPTEMITAFEYDTVGFPRSALIDGIQVTFTVDGFGRVIGTHVPEQEGVNRTILKHLVKGYDADGRIAWEGVFDEPPPGYAEPTELQAGLHAFSQYEYDLVGRRTAITQWRFTEEPLAADPEGLKALTTVDYDDSTNTVTAKDPAGRISVLRTDGAGRIVSEIRAAGLPEARSLTFDYSLDGTVMDVTVKPAPVVAGRTVQSFRLDPLGRLRSVIEDNRVVYTERQDSFGRTTERTLVGLGSQLLAYDAFNRLVTVQQQVDSDHPPVTATYSWDGNDLLRQSIDGANHVTVNSFDGLDRLKTVTNGIGTTSFSYVPGAEHVAQRVDPSGAIHDLIYDPAGRVLRIGSSVGGTLIVRQFSYTPLDQLREAAIIKLRPGVGILTPTNTVKFEYDSIGRKRMEASSTTGVAVRHSYSGFARTTELVREGEVSATITETCDGLFRPRVLSLNGSPVATMNYDGGSLTSILYRNGVAETFRYDSRARLIAARVEGNVRIAALTDVLGTDGIPRQRQRTFGSRLPTMDYIKWISPAD